jgi:hypothetical protein
MLASFPPVTLAAESPLAGPQPYFAERILESGRYQVPMSGFVQVTKRPFLIALPHREISKAIVFWVVASISQHSHFLTAFYWALVC